MFSHTLHFFFLFREHESEWWTFWRSRSYQTPNRGLYCTYCMQNQIDMPFGLSKPSSTSAQRNNKENLPLFWACVLCNNIFLRESNTTLTLHEISYRSLMFIGPCIIVIVEELKTNLMSLVVFISLIFAQHVSKINMSIFRTKT